MVLHGEHRWIRVGLALAFLVGALFVVTSHRARAATPAPSWPSNSDTPLGANDWHCRPTAAHPEPVVLVHGLLATGYENWMYMGPLIKKAGYCVFALTYGTDPGNPYVGGLRPMEESAQELDAFVDKVLAATGARQVDLVGHSEGTIMPQWWLKKLGGAAKTKRYVALAPIYAGTNVWGVGTMLDVFRSLSPETFGNGARSFDDLCGSCQEFLTGSDFYKALNSDGSMGAPGVLYTTVMSRYDELVTPYSSGTMVAPGATNIVLQDVCPLNLDEHLFLAFDPTVAQIVENALDPAHARPVDCGPLGGLGVGGLNTLFLK
jgi:pimeloyl-ACP methyl ester carboxylesterase